MQHRPEIDGLRAVAVLPVVLFHAGLGVFSGGYVGVDVFFVISGFLITGLIKEDLERDRFTILGFYNRRIRRILPALVFMALGTSAAAFVLLLPSFLNDYGWSLVSVSGFGSNFYFWKTSGYFDAAALLRPLLHTWSLAVEEQFYIFMPLLAFTIYRFLGKRWLVILGVFAALSLAISIYAVEVAPTANFYLLPTRAWELLLGGLLAVAPRRERAGRLDQVMSLLGIALIGWSVFAYDEATPFPGAAALAPCVGAALAIYFANPAHTLVGRLLTTKPMIGIGLISYSLYLIHWPIAVFWRYVTLLPPGLFGSLTILALSVLLAAFSWRYVEQPFRKRGGASNLQVIGVGLAALALLAGVGAAAVARNPAAAAEGGVVAGAGAGAGPGAGGPPTAQRASSAWRNGTCFLMGELDYSRWSAEGCVINPNGDFPVMLWGDSFAAHYAPGITTVAEGGPARVYQYTAAGCPPALDYYSYARPNCRAFNQNALRIIDELGVRRVILAARWVDLRSRGLGELRSTLQALDARGVEVVVIGQSPRFITDVAVIGARRGPDGEFLAAWRTTVDPRLNEQLRAIAGADRFVDPMAALCVDDVCPFRVGDRYIYWDDGHFSRFGSARAARAYLPLGAGD